MVKFLGTYETIPEIRESHYFDFLAHSFNQLGRSEKIRFLEDYAEEQNLAAGYLGLAEVKGLLFKGERKRAFELIEWLRDNFSHKDELQILLSDFEGRIENLSKIETKAIGIIMPFSGKRKSFAHRAMLGIDFALRKFQNKYDNIKIYTSDSQGDSLVGRRKVQELIEKHSVSFIIGGLFSDEAKEEYLEARKYGVMFISLSQIFIPRKEKSFLLVEIPGSVESQVKRLLSADVIGKFGKKIAVIYPSSDRGKSYIDEIWTQAFGREIQIVDVQSYPKATKDFRDPVAHILGLKYPRFRQEELNFMNQIIALEKTKTRRVQILPPVTNFDWIYAPVYPQEAIQIIPSFAYYDARRLNFIGSPSWRSQILKRASTGHIHFIGDGIDQVDGNILNSFIRQYKTRPRLIEINSLEAINIAQKFLLPEGGNKNDRELYNGRIRESGVLQGMTGRFHLLDGVWIKEMHPFKIKKDKVNRVDFSTPL